MRTFRSPAIVSAALCALFLVVYPTCNWITSLRTHVSSHYFICEKHLPFVPALVIPYMSIDMFFIVAPFLTTTRRELRILACRLAATILLAGICFLLFPMKFGFDRPPVTGVLGIIFNNFRRLDLPYNQCPSLHVALWMVLLDLYVRHTRGWARIFLLVWFFLILCSTILTYQHHIVDIVGGFGLATMCFYLIQAGSLNQPSNSNFCVAGYYGMAALTLTMFAFSFTPWTYLLLSPGIALVITATGYIGIGAGVYRKENGQLPWSTWIVMWPVLIGHRISLAYYARQCHAYDQLTDRLWIGRHLTRSEADQICADGVTAVLDLTSEFTEFKSLRDQNYLQLPTLDLTAPLPTQIDQAIEFILSYGSQGVVYLHCKVGYSRTAVIAGSYLLATGQAETVKQAIAMLAQVRPSIIVRPEAMQALHEYATKNQTFRQPRASLSGL